MLITIVGSIIYICLVILVFRIIARIETGETEERRDTDLEGDYYTYIYHFKKWNINSKWDLIKYTLMSVFFPITIVIGLLLLISNTVYRRLKLWYILWTRLPNF